MDRSSWRDVIVSWLILVSLFAVVLVMPKHELRLDPALFVDVPVATSPVDPPPDDGVVRICSERNYANETC
jgi:hypothetical protein